MLVEYEIPKKVDVVKMETKLKPKRAVMQTNSDAGMEIKIQMCKTEVAKITATINKHRKLEAEMKVVLAKHDAICAKKRKELRVNNDSILESEATLNKWMERLQRGQQYF